MKENIMAKMVSYRHSASVDNSVRFVQFAQDRIPGWAIDLQFYEDESQEYYEDEGHLHEEDA
jgi:hypothetical protein